MNDHDDDPSTAQRAGLSAAIGYGKPPRQHQWRPGQSGNPRGRPRKRRTIKDELEDALLARVTVQDSGKPVTLTMMALIIRNVVRDAAKRSLPAIRLVLALIDRNGSSTDTVLDAADLDAEDRAILESYLDDARKVAQSGERSREGGTEGASVGGGTDRGGQP